MLPHCVRCSHFRNGAIFSVLLVGCGGQSADGSVSQTGSGAPEVSANSYDGSGASESSEEGEPRKVDDPPSGADGTPLHISVPEERWGVLDCWYYPDEQDEPCFTWSIHDTSVVFD